jgi:hypothetical protein
LLLGEHPISCLWTELARFYIVWPAKATLGQSSNTTRQGRHEPTPRT